MSGKKHHSETTPLQVQMTSVFVPGNEYNALILENESHKQRVVTLEGTLTILENARIQLIQKNIEIEQLKSENEALRGIAANQSEKIENHLDRIGKQQEEIADLKNYVLKIRQHLIRILGYDPGYE